MHRQDASNIIRSLGSLLVLFLLYQLWIKPSWLTNSTPPPIDSAATRLPELIPPPVEPPRVQPDIPASRLIDVSTAPPSTELAVLRDELELGNYRTVEAGLARITVKRVSSKETKRFMAGLWNNLGVQQEKYAGAEISVTAFKRALSLDPDNATILLNLAQAYWVLRDESLTPELLERVIRSVPDDPFPRLALADVLMDRGLPSRAAAHLRTAAPAAKADPNLRDYFAQLHAKLDRQQPEPPPATRTASSGGPASSLVSAKAARAASPPPPLPASVPSRPVSLSVPSDTPATAPRPYRPPAKEHFTIRCEGPEQADQLAQVRAILEYAYQDMSQKFGRLPATAIPVILHMDQKFTGEAGNPAWADGLYDRSAGTIHVPMKDALTDLAVLSRVLRHQFAHALLQETAGSGATHVPRWLEEGLAIYLGEDPWPHLEDGGQQFSIVPLASLDSSWRQGAAPSATAYIESITAAKALVDGYSMYGARQLLNAMRLGQPLDRAMQEKLSVSLSQFEQTWEQQFRSGKLHGTTAAPAS